MAGGLLEPPLEGPLGEAGALHHLLDRAGDCEVAGQPALRVEDRGVAVVERRVEDDVGRLAVAVPL